MADAKYQMTDFKIPNAQFTVTLSTAVTERD